MAAIFFASCSNSGSSSKSEPLPGFSKSEIDSVSYAVGVSLGGMIKSSNMEDLNFAEITKGMQDMIHGKELKVKETQAGQIIQTYMMKAEVAKGKIREQEQVEFLAQNKTKDSVQTTESGLQYKVINAGNADIKAMPEDTVEVNYVGQLLDGTVFDSSIERGQTVKFALNNVIKGWTEGIQLVGEGGKIKLWIPFELGYGERQVGPIPGSSTLIFDVDVIKVYKAVPEKK